MKMLVEKLSKGRFRNEGELFAEPISDENVKLMGEMIALQALRNVMPYDFEAVAKLYNGLVKDLNRISQIDYTITDGYDYAQTAICFLYEFKGKFVNDIYGKDKSGKEITIKTACYRRVDRELAHFRRRIARNRQLEFEHNKKVIPDPKNYFEDDAADYDKADNIIQRMHLTDSEFAVLECCLNGMRRGEIMAALNLGRGSICFRKQQIRKKYAMYVGV